jgi:uncharacterized protein YndB with AHSA1/START domain
MLIMTSSTPNIQIYRVFIKASIETVWQAIVDGKITQRYGYQGADEFDLRPGGTYRSLANAEMQAAGMPEVVVSGEVIEVEPPVKLVQTWNAAWNADGPTRLTWELAEGPDGVTAVTVTHDVTGAPETASMIGGQIEGAGGGWPMVLSDMKTLLETGRSMHG